MPGERRHRRPRESGRRDDACRSAILPLGRERMARPRLEVWVARIRRPPTSACPANVGGCPTKLWGFYHAKRPVRRLRACQLSQVRRLGEGRQAGQASLQGTPPEVPLVDLRGLRRMPGRVSPRGAHGEYPRHLGYVRLAAERGRRVPERGPRRGTTEAKPRGQRLGGGRSLVDRRGLRESAGCVAGPSERCPALGCRPRSRHGRPIPPFAPAGHRPAAGKPPFLDCIGATGRGSSRAVRPDRRVSPRTSGR